jgi:hypothetical protein
MSRLLTLPAEVRFPPGGFVATQHSSADAKARFANHYVRFVAAGFAYDLFQPWFYRRLSTTFGHIAHYDLEGFYHTWFGRTFDQHGFVDQALRWRCPGDPAYTYCDVEAVLQEWLRSVGAVEVLAARLAAEREAADRAQLQELLGRYGVPPEFRRLALPAAGGRGRASGRPLRAQPLAGGLDHQQP